MTSSDDNRIICGENHYNWKGGVTQMLPNNRRAKHVELNQWAKKVYKKDNYTCQICHEKGKNLHAHHIKAFADYPEGRFDILNGITLCKSCHIWVHRIQPLNQQ